MAKRKPAPSALPPGKGLLVWVAVGVAAFLMGGLVALFATREDGSSVAPVAPAASQNASPGPAAPSAAEPPAVSIDELPIEGSKKR
jgi:hypothetical protein